MKSEVSVQEASNTHVRLIMNIREKVRLLNKCRRKLEMSRIDPDNYRIYIAAYKQLQMEINKLCYQAGM